VYNFNTVRSLFTSSACGITLTCAGVNRLGVGIASLESKIKSIGNSTSLTRAETISLFSEFDKNYKFVSFRILFFCNLPKTV
jgi:hypothetical protein